MQIRGIAYFTFSLSCALCDKYFALALVRESDCSYLDTAKAGTVLLLRDFKKAAYAKGSQSQAE